MKKTVAAAVAALSFAGVAFADTAIPSGKALYDIALTFTDYPELYDYGDWPVEIGLAGLGQTFYGERASVVTNNDSSITLTVRGIWDIQKIIDDSKSESYTGGQSHIHTRFGVSESFYSDHGGVWTSFNGKYSFVDVTTVEGFSDVVANGFLDTTGHRTMSNPDSRSKEDPGEPVMLNAMTMKLVRDDNTQCTPGTPVLCKLRARFNRPLSAAGYESVTSFRLRNIAEAGTVFDFSIAHAAMSDDGYEIYGLVNADVGTILTLINSDDYKTAENYKGQTRLYLNGSSTSIAGGSLYWLSATDDSMTVADLSASINSSIIYCDRANIPCRIVSVDLEPKTNEGGLFLMRW